MWPRVGLEFRFQLSERAPSSLSRFRSCRLRAFLVPDLS